VLTQHAYDLILGKTASPHRSSPSDELTYQWHDFRGARQARSSPGRTIYDWRHYLAVVQRKPGAMRNGAPFTKLPDAFRQLRQQLLRRAGGEREMVDILALVLQHDEQAVLCAVELALEAGVATKTHILNILHRLVDEIDRQRHAHRCAPGARPAP
jgi:hypothetical protein